MFINMHFSCNCLHIFIYIQVNIVKNLYTCVYDDNIVKMGQNQIKRIKIDIEFENVAEKTGVVTLEILTNGSLSECASEKY